MEIMKNFIKTETIDESWKILGGFKTIEYSISDK
jgi:hypothetical protein